MGNVEELIAGEDLKDSVKYNLVGGIAFLAISVSLFCDFFGMEIWRSILIGFLFAYGISCSLAVGNMVISHYIQRQTLLLTKRLKEE
jgi:uncharacterized membrane protein